MKKSDLLDKKLTSCAISSTILGILDFTLFLADFVVSGRFLGKDALAGLAVMNPLITFLTFISIIIPLGTTAAIGYTRGNGDKKSADRYFSQGLIASNALGAVFVTIMFGLSHGFLEKLPLSGELSGYANDYCTGLIFMPFFMIVNMFIYYMHIGEGFEKTCIVSSVAKLSVNIALDIILCGIWGTFGVGVATTLGYLASLIVKLIPVFMGRFSFRFRFWFNIRSIFRLTIDGLMLSSDFLCPVLFASVMNLSVLAFLGEPGLAVFSIILNIQTLCTYLYSFLTNSIQSAICQNYAEESYISIRRTMKYMVSFLIVLSCVISVLFMIGSRFIPVFFGLTDNSLVNASSHAIICYVPFVVFLGISTLLSRYYVCIRHGLYGFLLLFFSSIVFPLIFELILGNIWHGNGVWLGFGIGYLVTFILNCLFVQKITGADKATHHTLLLYDLLAEKRQLYYSIKSGKDEIMDCVDAINTKLKSITGLSAGRRNRIVLLVEENCMNISERNRDTASDLEINVICPENSDDKFALIIRSNGIMPDITDDSARISSLREYVLANIAIVSGDSFFMHQKTESTISFKC